MYSLRPLQWTRCFVSCRRINLVQVSLVSIKVFDNMSNNIERSSNVPVTNTLSTSGHNVFVTNSALTFSTSANPCGVATTSVVGPNPGLSQGCIGMIRVTPLPKYPAELVSLKTSDTDQLLQIPSNRRTGRKTAPSTRTYQDLNTQSEAGHFFSHYFPKVMGDLAVSKTGVPSVEAIDITDQTVFSQPKKVSSELAISDSGLASATESKSRLETSRKRMTSPSIIKVSGPPPKHAKRIDDIDHRRPPEKLTLSLGKSDDKMDGTDATDQGGNKVFDAAIEGPFDLLLPLSHVGRKTEMKKCLESSNFTQMSEARVAGDTELALRDTRRYLDHESLSAGVTEVSQSDDDSGISCFPDQSLSEITSPESPTDIVVLNEQSPMEIPASESPAIVLNKQSCAKIPSSEGPIVVFNEQSPTEIPGSESPAEFLKKQSCAKIPSSSGSIVARNEQSPTVLPSSESQCVVLNALSSMESSSSESPFVDRNEQSCTEFSSSENPCVVPIALSPTNIIASNKQSLSEMSVNPAGIVVEEQRSSELQSSETATNTEHSSSTKPSPESPTNIVDLGEPLSVDPNVTVHDTDSKLSSSDQQVDALLSIKPSVLPKELLSSVTQFVKEQINNSGFSGDTLSIASSAVEFAQSESKRTACYAKTSALSADRLGNDNFSQHPNMSGDDKLESNHSLSQAPQLPRSNLSDSNHSVSRTSSDGVMDTEKDFVTGLPFMDVTDIDTSSPERLDTAGSSVSEKPDRRSKKKAAKRKRNVDEENENSEESKKRSKPKAVRPNYFIAVQVTNPKIHGDLRKVQTDVIEKKKLLQDAAIPLPTLHLTLMVMHLATEDDINKAKGALDDSEQKLSDMKEKPLRLTVTGLGNFRNNVVFAKVQEGAALDHMYQVADTVSGCFTEHGVLSADKKGFKPHITIFKLSRAPRLRKKGVKIVDPEFYQGHVDTVFGQQTVESLQLCSMLKPKDENGYYSVLHTVPLVPSDWRSMDYEESVDNMSPICQENVNSDFDGISTLSENLKTPDPNSPETINQPSQDNASSDTGSISRPSDKLETSVSNSTEKCNATDQENASSDVGSISRQSGELKTSFSDVSSISNLREDLNTPVSSSPEKLNPEDYHDVFSVKLEKELTWSFTKGKNLIEESSESSEGKDGKSAAP